jgi:predicted esterase
MRSTLLVILAACSGGPADSELTPDAGRHGGSSADAPGGQAAPQIPHSTGTCPTIASGDVTFAPAGMPPRKVKLALDASTSAPGPLVLYWHATFSGPNEAAYALGSTQMSMTSDGGVVAAPYADPSAGTYEWFLVNQSPKLDDFLLADEIVACLVEAGRVDPSRIHSLGMSAGALQTTAMSFYRSAYIASVATFSGGMPDGFDAPTQNETNKFAALIFSGGASDNVFGVDFQAASERYQSMLVAGGHYAELCNHGNGHEIPLDAAPSVRLFFAANPFGAWPSPYATGLPASFPAYCAR